MNTQDIIAGNVTTDTQNMFIELIEAVIHDVHEEGYELSLEEYQKYCMKCLTRNFETLKSIVEEE